MSTLKIHTQHRFNDSESMITYLETNVFLSHGNAG